MRREQEAVNKKYCNRSGCFWTVYYYG